MDCTKNNCPNCGSGNFRESIRHESCPDCGYEFCYGGQGIPSGGNAVYEALNERNRHEWLREQHEWEVGLMLGHCE